jgi:hypothetical protein
VDNSIRNGTPWTGIVKNRCKNGDYYWVKANITPIRDAGRTIGYMSVRTRADRSQVEQAIEAYRTLREGNASSWHRNGQVIHRGWRNLLSRLTPCVARHAHLALHQRGQHCCCWRVHRQPVRQQRQRRPLRHLRRHLHRPADQRLPVVHAARGVLQPLGRACKAPAPDRRRRPVRLLRHAQHR